MPQLWRVRFTNIEYDHGKKVISDELFRPQGENTLFNLANGGGKTLLIQLLLQAVLPNEGLNKRAISDLLAHKRYTGHILLEWKLDNQADSFVTTGFCFTKGSEDEGRLRYFMYTVEYTEPNDFDILHLPIVEDSRPIAYLELLKLLKDSSKYQAARILVFDQDDKKSRYTRHLASFNLFAKEWDSIKATNGAEGGMEGFFTRAKTTKQLLEHLLIPSVERVLFKSKDSETELAKSFNEYFGSLQRIPELEKNLRDFATLKDGGEKVLVEVSSYAKSVEEFTGQKLLLRKAYNQSQAELGNVIEQLGQTEAEIKLIQAELDELKYQKDSLPYINTLEKLQTARAEQQELAEKLADLEGKAQTAYYSFHKAKGQNWYLDIRGWQAEINSYTQAKQQASQGHEEDMTELHSCQVTLRTRLSERIAAHAEKVAVLTTEITAAENSKRDLAGKAKELNSEVSRLNQQHGKLAAAIERYEASRQKLWDNYQNMVWLEQPAEALQELNTELTKLAVEQEKIKTTIAATQARNAAINRELLEVAGQIVSVQTELSGRQADLANYQQEYDDVRARLALQSIAVTGLFEQQDRIKLQLVTKQQELERKVDNKLVELKGLKDQLELLEKHDYYIPNRDVLKLKALLEDKGIVCQTGSQWLKGLNLDEDEISTAIRENPLLPYALVVMSERDIKRLGELSLPKDLLLNSPVPLVVRPTLGSGDVEQQALLKVGQAWYLWHKGYNYASSQASLTQLAEELKEQLERENIILEDRKAVLSKVTATLQLFDQFQRRYDGNSEANLLAEVDKATQALAAKKAAQLELEGEQEEAETKLVLLERELSGTQSAAQEIKDKLKEWQNWQEDYPKYQNALAEQKAVEGRLRELGRELEGVERKKEELDSRHVSLGQRKTGIEHELSVLNQRLSKVPQPGDRNAPVKESSLEQAELDLDIIDQKIRGINASLNHYDDLIREKQRNVDDYTNRIEQELKLKLAEVDAAEIRFTQSQLAEFEQAAAELEKEVTRVKENFHVLDKAISGLESTLKAKEEEIKGKYGRPPLAELDKLNQQKLDMEIRNAKNQLTEWQGLSQEYLGYRGELEKALAGLNTHLSNYDPPESEAGLSQAEWVGYRNTPLSLVKELGEKLKFAQQRVNTQKEATSKAWKGFAAAVKNQNNNILDKILLHLLSQESVQFDYASIYPSFNKLFATIEEYTAKAEYELETCHQNREILRDRCITQAERVAEQLKSVDRYVRVEYAGREVNAVRIKLRDWEEEQAKAIMESYINVCVADLEKMGQRGEAEEKQLKYITDQMSSRQLLHTLANLDLCAVEVLKPEQHPTSPRYSKWEEVQKWSGGEQFAGYTAMFMAILSYTRSQESSERNQSKVLLADNPFGKASSPHVLELIFRLAEKNNIQMICFSALTEDNIYSYFRRVYSLKLRGLMGKDYIHSQLESGSYHLDALEEELLQRRQVAFDWGS
jgi:chromosome segregation ATPase